ncbi:MAG TPA: Crp/Fnr family transcriptional regulator [Candidatus Saccharimonadales bacterium]|nr:Crp/Fnr family transcriptional regulator [Candidatus Saccharimonadales bacterium]
MSSEVSAKVHEQFSQYPNRQYPKGQILVFADENPEHIFYIVSGRVRKYDVSYRGEEVIVNIFKEHSFFPMSWAINKSKNRYFYKTETDTELHIVPADDALQFLKENPDVMLDLLSRLYSGMEGLFGRMVHLMSGSARSRLLYELIIECRRFGKQQQDGSYILAATEVDLAARSGLSRETISREMRTLKEKRWLAISKNSITVSDITKLEAAVGSEV